MDNDDSSTNKIYEFISMENKFLMMEIQMIIIEMIEKVDELMDSKDFDFKLQLEPKVIALQVGIN